MPYSNDPTLDYDVFYRNWEPRVRMMAAQRGLYNEDLDDCVMIVMGDLWRGGYLEAYDPNRGKFTSYIYAQIRYRILGYFRSIAKHSTCDPIEEIDVADPEDCLLSVDLAQALMDAGERLGSESLVRLLVDIVEQLKRTGSVSYADIGRKRGKSRQAVQQQVKTLANATPMLELREVLYH